MTDNHVHPTEKQYYLSYLVRLWRQRNGHGLAWHASLESPLDGTRLAFGDLPALFEFLVTETDAARDQEIGGFDGSEPA